MSSNEVPGKRNTRSEGHKCASKENCQNCADDNKQTEAHGFCVKCHEYMCQECVQFHKRVRATKSHFIQDSRLMPRDVEEAHHFKDICTEACSKHPGKNIEYYCDKHNELGCNVCVTLWHITCGVEYIPELSVDIANCDEYKGLLESINEIQQQSADASIKLTEVIQDIENKSKTCADEITQQGEITINHVRELVGKAIQEKDKFVKDTLSRMTTIQEQNKGVAEEMNSINMFLETKKHFENQSFVLMKRFPLKIKSANEEMRKISKLISKPTVFQFSVNNEMEDLNSIDSIGTVTRHQTVVEQHEDIDVSSERDGTCPWITGLEVLSDGRLAMADYNNESIKIVETTTESVLKIELQHEPWDLTEVRNGQLAVTLPHARKILFLMMDNTFSFGHVIDTREQCNGITAHEDNLIVSYRSSEIENLDMTGQVLRRFKAYQNGGEIHENPYFIKFDSKTNMLFVSDEMKHTLTCMDLDGEVRFVYSDENLNAPYGLAINTDGSAYICSKGNIHHVSADGSKIQQIIEKEQGETEATSVVVCAGKLYLGGSSRQLRVYQLG